MKTIFVSQINHSLATVCVSKFFHQILNLCIKITAHVKMLLLTSHCFICRVYIQNNNMYTTDIYMKYLDYCIRIEIRDILLLRFADILKLMDCKYGVTDKLNL